jgi:hypothetical protein
MFLCKAQSNDAAVKTTNPHIFREKATTHQAAAVNSPDLTGQGGMLWELSIRRRSLSCIMGTMQSPDA